VSHSSPVRLPALVAVSALSLTGLVVLAAAPASAAVPTPDPVCDASTCTVTFGYTGDVQSFTVPVAVSELQVSVSGASGGDARPGFASVGGQGGATQATMETTPGTSFEVLVGGAGRTGGSRSFGGGGGTASTSYLGSGGGGSFLFRADGTPAVVSGGGGGGGGINAGAINGGGGAGAGLAGADGSSEPFYNPSTPARGGSATASDGRTA
jgi:Glycine rich protein